MKDHTAEIIFQASRVVFWILGIITAILITFMPLWAALLASPNHWPSCWFLFFTVPVFGAFSYFILWYIKAVTEV